MAAFQANIEFLIPADDVIPPSCTHGPALLFERFDQSSQRLRQFFACSAFRDKKACGFHQWLDEKISKSTEIKTEVEFSHRQLRKRYQKFKKMEIQQRSVCCTCGLLLLPSEINSHKKQGHSIKNKVKLKELKRPSLLFKPLDNNKTFAQYLFSRKTVDFLLSTVEQLNYTHLLCVGAPRIHEEVQFRRKTANCCLTSMLLDLDERYAQLYPPKSYCKYNMFNHHFFEPSGEGLVQEFLRSGLEQVLLITDPPFGGMVEALAQTFLKLSQMWETACGLFLPADNRTITKDISIPIIWIFPYFMENRIVSNFPSLAVLDYKVDYDNHNLFNNNSKKKGSPVRMFTNIAQVKFILPEEEGYWFCELCQRYSAQENKHCKECGICPSKDGSTYEHCDICQRCVKPSRVHCFKCGVCVLKDHRCGVEVSTGCHICGELGHKRRECPQRHTSIQKTHNSLKRGKSMPTFQNKKKKKR